MTSDPIRQAAIDLLHKGGCSAPMLGGELVKRGLIPGTEPVATAFAKARQVLDAMVAEGTANKWPDGYCYTITEKRNAR